MLLTVSQSEAWFRQGKPYFEYAVPYEAWVKRVKRKPV